MRGDVEVIDVDMDMEGYPRVRTHGRDHAERVGVPRRVSEPGKGNAKGEERDIIDVDALDDAGAGPSSRKDERREGELRHRPDDTDLGPEGRKDDTVLDASPPPAPAAPEALTAMPVPAAVPGPETQPPVRPLRNHPHPRNGGLLSAVHAHLGASAPARKPRPANTGETPAGLADLSRPHSTGVSASSPGSTPASAKPPLLGRISNMTTSLSATPPPDTPSTPGTPGLQGLDAARQSGRDVAARLARLKNEPPSALVPVPAPSPDISLGTDARARLLSRLEKAKRQAEAEVEVEGGTEEFDPTMGAEAEARLRRKAQVRVRLAAAKRERDREQQRGMVLGDGVDGGMAGGGPEGEGNREHELKMKIMVRR